MIRFGVVGTGWRTEFFLRVAQARPDLFEAVGVVSRDPARTAAWAKPFGVPLYASLDELLHQNPLFVITSVPWDSNPGIITTLAERGIPVLSETPPATHADEMTALYRLVEQGAKIAVAEQYHLHPHHAARLAFVESGKLGAVSHVHISVAHGYHGISLMRRFLGIGAQNATITAQLFSAPIVTSRDRDGYPEHESISHTQMISARFEFGDKLGVFDFVGDQYWSPIRRQRVLVRGERGEIIDHSATYLQDHLTPIHVDFERVYAGVDGNLEGHHLKGIRAGEAWLYHNPMAPARLFDDEMAIGDCLLRMADYAHGGEPFYSLAEACQDRYLDIMMWLAAESGETITTENQAWAQSLP